MDLFKILGRFAIEGAADSVEDINDVSDSAQEAAEAIVSSNNEAQESSSKLGAKVTASGEKIKKSHKAQKASVKSLTQAVAEYKAKGLSTSAAWRKASEDMKNSTQRSTSSMHSNFKKIGAAVATYFSVSAIKNFTMACVEASAEAAATSAQFSQVFGDSENAAQKSLNAIAADAGIVETRMKASFTKIAAFAKTTGMDTESALGLAERSMIAVADSAAFYDRSLEETTESLQSFLKGNYENDSALGLSCTETTRNEAANRLYGQSFKDLSEAQKQLTLLQMVEDANKASGALGQAARESDGWENVIGNLKQSWKDLQAELGKYVLPHAINLVKKMTTGLQAWTDKIPVLLDWIKQHDTELSVAAILLGALAAAIAVYNLGMDAAAIKTAIMTAATGAFGAVMAFVTSPITLVILAIGALVAAGVALYKNWDVVSAKAKELWGKLTDGFEDLRGKVTAKFDSIKSAIGEKIDAARDKVKEGVDKIKGFFDFSWSLPKLKLPHFSISGRFSLSPPSAPKFAVQWYKKAMRKPMIMDKPTVFGYNPASGKLQAGGEAGSEVVSGTGTLMGMITAAVQAENGAVTNRLDAIISMLGKFFPESLGKDTAIYLDKRQLVAVLGPAMDEELGRLKLKKGRGR